MEGVAAPTGHQRRWSNPIDTGGDRREASWVLRHRPAAHRLDVGRPGRRLEPQTHHLAARAAQRSAHDGTGDGAPFTANRTSRAPPSGFVFPRRMVTSTPSPAVAGATSAHRRALTSLRRSPAMKSSPTITATSWPRFRANLVELDAAAAAARSVAGGENRDQVSHHEGASLAATATATATDTGLPVAREHPRWCVPRPGSARRRDGPEARRGHRRRRARGGSPLLVELGERRVLENVVSWCGKRGQPVRKARSTSAESAVNRCGGIIDSPVFSRFYEFCPIFPISPISPGKERGKSRWRRAFAAHAARRHRILPPHRTLSSLNISSASTRKGAEGSAPVRRRHDGRRGCRVRPDGHRIGRRRGRVSSPGTRPPCRKRRPTQLTADRPPTAARQPVHRPATSSTRSTSSKLRYG